jgi:signal transduction histidine kinase
LFGACLLVLITASFWWYGSLTEDLVYEQNPITGRLLVDQVMLFEHWAGLETDHEYLPALEYLAESLSKQDYDWEFLLCDGSIRCADGTKKQVDDFEEQVLRAFLKDESEVPPFKQRLLPHENSYQYYKPIYAEASCIVSCHRASPGAAALNLPGAQVGLGVPVEAEGDLIAVTKITIPTGPVQRALTDNRAILVATAIITVFLAMVASYAIVRYVIVKPLRHLRDVSDAISRGNIALRADIHTGDEFEALAVAFNRMLRHLVTAQQELREVNTDLDSKVDELAQLNMRLYEMNTVKSDFLATMSHELRTPLNSILGFSDVLVSNDALSDQQKRYVLNIQSSGRMLLEMINDILDLAKIESGRVDIRLTDFQIGQIINAQCDMARPLSARKNIDLEAHVQHGLPPMHQDQARVQQILNNLLSNAIKFTPEGGRISVSARRTPHEMLVMEVSDTGVGIAEEDQQVIFEKFRQGHGTLPSGDAMTREYSGTGLGLSIVKELCKLLGGEISVESELGKGSKFTVTLPWVLQEHPRMESVLTEEFEALTRLRGNLVVE